MHWMVIELCACILEISTLFPIVFLLTNIRELLQTMAVLRFRACCRAGSISDLNGELYRSAAPVSLSGTVFLVMSARCFVPFGRAKPATPPNPTHGGPIGGGVSLNSKAFQPHTVKTAGDDPKGAGTGSKTMWQDSRWLKFPDRVSPEAQALRDKDAAQSHGDRRFFRKIEDFREIQENDPYSSIFREKASTIKLRLQAWRAQYEKENATVEAPYERTNPIFRMAPNAWVRLFIRVRDDGGISSGWVLHLGMAVIAAVAIIYTAIVYVRPKDAKALRNVQ